MAICMLSAANLGSTTVYSCIAPFYPNAAKVKGLGSFETGIVFGIFELIMFFAAPLFGKYVILGHKRMFVFGIAVTGTTAMLFGFLNYIESSSLFFWCSVTIRIAEAVGDAAFVTSSFAIAAKRFPGRVATIIGILETFAGLGYTAGPPLGGMLYEIGGFQLPFLVLGLVLLFISLLAYFLIEKIDAMNGKDMLGMLKIPVFWIMIYAVFLCAISLSFLDPTLAHHLESFKLSTTVVGLMFLLCGGIYTITAMFWGVIVDKFSCHRAILFFGATAVVLSMVMIGPLPLLKVEKNLAWIAIALGVLGVAASAIYIPTFQACIDAVCEYGYEDSAQTYGCVSGVVQSAFAFGSFIGPTIGGLCAEWIGFAWTAAIIALLNIIFVSFCDNFRVK
ncbi:unnamed protein product [Thelazia callipaeda]|uniref:MFS domain-containing protein n=1 Tax=Thelazia callipaeda TaxID=103827 RepID=A0A0N5CZW4_THECL|nr:unnamed protein product [Thelazia callipaeda]